MWGATSRLSAVTRGGRDPLVDTGNTIRAVLDADTSNTGIKVDNRAMQDRRLCGSTVARMGT